MILTIKSQPIIKIGKVPKWMIQACEIITELFDLQEYKIQVRYTDLKSANNWFKRHGIQQLEITDKAAVIVDTDYLIAHVFFLKPMKNDKESYAIILHELMHIVLRHRVFDRIKNEVPMIQDDLDHEAKLLKIEERFTESLLNLLEKTNVLNHLETTLKA